METAPKYSLNRLSVILPLVILLALITGFINTHAQERVERSPIASRASTAPDQTPPDEAVVRRLSQQTGPVQIVIELADEPATRTFALTRARTNAVSARVAGQSQIARIERAQQVLLPSLAQLNARLIYRVKRVYNGIAVEVDATQLNQIRQLPGVKAIHQLISKHPLNATSVPFIGAPVLWTGSGLNLTGNGIKIGLIDTGIDYRHADFAGTSTSRFPTAKVVGGTDFVGDVYNGTNAPVPGNDPHDCFGHGTHVGGTLAGFGVNADGSVYTGGYGPNTPFSTLKIGPGVAPNAKIYSLRVFGCSGGSNVVDQAIEWAVDPNGDGDFSDHLDVINMSLGADYGSDYDTTSVASDNAALAGVIVVAAAGNSRDSYYVTGSPADAGRAISVAASVDAGLTAPAMQINSPAPIAGLIAASAASFGPPPPQAGLSADLVYATPNDGCAPITTNLAGKIALVDRGPFLQPCAFLGKVLNAHAAGAIGAIVANNVDGPPFHMGPADSSVPIPSVMIEQQDADQIKAALSNSTVNVTLQPDLIATLSSQGDTLTSFTSRGPRRGDSQLKPDIAAPGFQIPSALINTSSGVVTMSGTSMASPHVAGGMALLRELHPTWTVEELKALVMNTATHDLRSSTDPASQIYGPGRVGAGRIDLANASASSVIAYVADNSGLVNVSFGVVEVVNNVTQTKTVRISNKGNTTASFNLAYVPVTTVPGVTFTLPDGSSVTVPANGQIDIHVQLTADSSVMTHTHDATISLIQSAARHWLSEASGYLTLTPIANGTMLRVPVYAAARPAGTMAATQQTLNLSLSPTAVVSLTGQTVNTGSAFPTSEVSLFSAFELQAVNPIDQGSKAPFGNSNLQYVGINSDYKAAGSMAATMINFGLATYANWSSPNEAEFDIFIDVDGDGVDDYELYNASVTSSLSQSNPSKSFGGDEFVGILVNLKTTISKREFPINKLSPAVMDTVPFNTNVMMLSVAAADLGLTDSSSHFNYHVDTQNVDIVGRIDSVKGLSYDVAHPGLDLTGGVAGSAILTDAESTTLSVNYDQARYVAAGSQGLLMLHYHNVAGMHAEVIGIANPLPSLTGISPSTAQAGATDLKITVSGSNFTPGAVVNWNGAGLVTTFVSSAQLTAIIPKADFLIPSNNNVTVTNPAPGGGLSGTSPFAVTPAVYGDLNNDNVIDASDLVLMANYLAGNVTINTVAGDVFADGVVNSADLVTLANYLAGNISQLPVRPLGP